MIKKYRVKVNGKEYRVEVESEDGGSYEIRKREETVPVKGKLAGTGGVVVVPEVLGVEGKSVRSPMPAKVISVRCREGDSVKKGDVLVVLEAMKMENEVLSPLDGVIKEVKVREGSSISHDEVIIIFE